MELLVAVVKTSSRGAALAIVRLAGGAALALTDDGRGAGGLGADHGVADDLAAAAVAPK